MGTPPWRCAPYWPAACLVASPTSPRSPSNRSGATSTPTPGLAARAHQEAEQTAPTAQGGVTWGASRPEAQQAKKKNSAATEDNPPSATNTPWSGPRSYTPPSMTTPASPSAEIHHDEKAMTPVGVLRRAVTWLAAPQVHIERVLADNGSTDRSPCSAIPAPIPQSPTNEPALPAADPTPRSDASTPPWPTATGSNASTPANASHRRRSQHGFTRTTTNGPTPRSARPHQSVA
jgi:hypothetical protein